MREIAVGDRAWRLIAIQRGPEWIARAEDVKSGDRHDMECAGPSEAAALDRLARWLVWQSEHQAALEMLQRAERAYHRTVAGSAFANPTEGPTAIELQQESLHEVESARVRLDEVRSRKPDP
jgi:hypothetical protein